MTARAESGADLHHALNNLFTKIMGAADLALCEPCRPQVKFELETIVDLVKEGCVLVEGLNTTPRAS
jgi:hypothetical protein